jgi:hypothetical protein
MEFAIPYEEFSSGAADLHSFSSPITVCGATLLKSYSYCRSAVVIGDRTYKFNELLSWQHTVGRYGILTNGTDVCGWFIGKKPQMPTAPIVTPFQQPDDLITTFVSTVWTECPLELLKIVESYVIKFGIFADVPVEYCHDVEAVCKLYGRKCEYTERAPHHLHDIWSKPDVAYTFVCSDSIGYAIDDSSANATVFVIDADVFAYHKAELYPSGEPKGFRLCGGVLYASNGRTTVIAAVRVERYEEIKHRKYLMAHMMTKDPAIGSIVSVRPSDMHVAIVSENLTDEII